MQLQFKQMKISIEIAEVKSNQNRPNTIPMSLK